MLNSFTHDVIKFYYSLAKSYIIIIAKNLKIRGKLS